jgi:hypothetical protein
MAADGEKPMAIDSSAKAGGVWLILPTVGCGLIALGCSLIGMQVWLVPWLEDRTARDPLKRLADDADELANQVVATRDQLAADSANPMPAVRAFENELGVGLHNMFHQLVAKKLLTAGEQPLFYNHDQLESWQVVATRLRQAAVEARNRAYGTRA